MAWPEDDRARRVSVAKELDRQTFWKSVYAAAVPLGQGNLFCEEMANRALLDFDCKFKDSQS